MRTTLTAALAQKPIPIDGKGLSRQPDAFRAGDHVVLADGLYKGTPGVFVGFRGDANWADITERNGSIRSHPVAWLMRGPAA